MGGIYCPGWGCPSPRIESGNVVYDNVSNRIFCGYGCAGAEADITAFMWTGREPINREERFVRIPIEEAKSLQPTERVRRSETGEGNLFSLLGDTLGFPED